MNPPAIFWKSIDALAVFLSTWIILALWAGYAGVLSPLILVVAGIITYTWARNQNPAFAPGEKTLRVSLILIPLVMGLIFFGIQGGYDLSADAAPNVATQIVTTTIPSTYTPYFDIPLVYQMGLPAIASTITTLGIPSHVILWFFSLLGIILFLAGLIQLETSRKGVDRATLFWIPILLLASRLPYYNLLVGEYPWLLAAGLGMMGMAWYSKSWRIGTLLFAAALITHPYIGVLIILAWVLLTWPTISTIVKTGIVAFVAGIPLIVFQVIPFLGLEKIPFSGSGNVTLSAIIGNIMLVGVIPFLLALAWGIHHYLSKKPFTRNDYAWILLAFGSILAGVVFNALWPGIIFGTKFPALALIGMIILGARGMGKMIPSHQRWVAAIVILLVAGTLMVTSTSIQSYVNGSKSSLEEAQFATRLYAYDASIVPVLFLSPGVGKMAQYSKKIPSDPTHSHFMLGLQLLSTPEALLLKQQSVEHQILFQSQCASCVDEFLAKYPQKYVVVNTLFFPELNGKEKLLEEGTFILYRGNE